LSVASHTERRPSIPNTMRVRAEAAVKKITAARQEDQKQITAMSLATLPRAKRTTVKASKGSAVAVTTVGPCTMRTVKVVTR
jgi:hypothetical protein